MNLEVLLEPIERAPKERKCKVAETIDRLEEPYRKALANLVATTYQMGGLTDEELSARLRDAGIGIGTTVINKHRRQRCVCATASE